MHCHHNNTLRAITNGFAINHDILAVRVASWNGAEDAIALLATNRCGDDTRMQCFQDNHAAIAAKALSKAAAHVNLLVASRRQEDEARTQAFVSVAGKRDCWEATLHKP